MHFQIDFEQDASSDWLIDKLLTSDDNFDQLGWANVAVPCSYRNSNRKSLTDRLNGNVSLNV